jgi:hypothetical protein
MMTTMMTTETMVVGTRCSARVNDAGSWRDRACVNKAKVTENGKALCGIHSTATADKKAAKDARRNATRKRVEEIRLDRSNRLLNAVRSATGLELKYAGATYGRDGIRSSVTIPFDEMQTIVTYLENIAKANDSKT